MNKRDSIKLAITADCLDKRGNFIIPGPGLALIEDFRSVKYEILRENNQEISPKQVRGFDVVFTLGPRWTRNSISQSEQLVLVQKFGVGYDNIDVATLTEAGIMLCNTPKGVRRPMATAILTFILTLSTCLVKKNNLMKAGGWEKADFLGEGLTNKVLGLLGVGNIGRELLKLVKPLEMRHLAYDPYVTAKEINGLNVELVDLKTLLTESDFLCLCAPLTEQTYHIIGANQLRIMKRTAYLINIARGSLIDEVSLERALIENIVAGAGLDAFEQEPISPGSPLLKLENVIVTPHSIGKTKEAYSVIWSEMCRHLNQLIEGQIPDDLVNKSVLANPRLKEKIKNLKLRML